MDCSSLSVASGSGSESVKKRKRSTNWSSMETHAFLASCKEREIVKMMDGKRHRWIDVMRPVRKDLLEHEMKFDRDEDTLVTKFKALKLLYNKAKEHNSRSGNDPSHFEFLQEMDDIFGARPRITYPLLHGVEREDEIEVVQDNYNSDDLEEEEVIDNTVEIDVLDDVAADRERNVSQPASAKKRKYSKSYGGALLDFSDSFTENLKEVNKEFLAGQALLQQQQQEFEKQMAEDERNFLRSLFQPNN